MILSVSHALFSYAEAYLSSERLWTKVALEIGFCRTLGTSISVIARS